MTSHNHDDHQPALKNHAWLIRGGLTWIFICLGVLSPSAIRRRPKFRKRHGIPRMAALLHQIRVISNHKFARCMSIAQRIRFLTSILLSISCQRRPAFRHNSPKRSRICEDFSADLRKKRARYIPYIHVRCIYIYIFT